MYRLIDWLFLRHWRALDRSDESTTVAVEEMDDNAAIWRPLIILVTVAVSLTLQEYFGDRTTFYQWFPRNGEDVRDWQLMSFVWWSGWRFGGYIVLPLLTIFPMKWFFGGPPLSAYYI